HLRDLVALKLDQNRLRPEGAAALCAVLGTRMNNTLRELSLAENELGGENGHAAHSLATMLRVNTSLRRLDLHGNHWLAADAVIITEAIRPMDHLEDACCLDCVIMEAAHELPVGALLRDDPSIASLRQPMGMSVQEAIVLGRTLAFSRACQELEVEDTRLDLGSLRRDECQAVHLADCQVEFWPAMVLGEVLLRGRERVEGAAEEAGALEALRLQRNFLCGRERDVEAEVPQGLRSLGAGLSGPGFHPTLLDLSDNIIGPQRQQAEDHRLLRAELQRQA
ncbi:hypothetical protein CYMTET_42662, partial [Cymbomonas tetramitiformis]